MSKAVMKRVLEALVRVNASPHLQDLHHAFDEEITALRAALAEPEQERPHLDYPCRSDGRCQYAIDSGAEGLGHCPPGKCCMAARLEPTAQEVQNAAENLALMKRMFPQPQTTHWEGCEAVHPECRKPEQEPDGISWLKRDSGYFTAPNPQREHITDGSPCWCNPDVFEEDGGNVIVHNYEDNWQQYAKPGETAQQCIERHRAEQDALMKLYATPRKPVELTDEQIAQVLGDVRESITGNVFLAFARAIIAAYEAKNGITGETK